MADVNLAKADLMLNLGGGSELKGINLNLQRSFHMIHTDLSVRFVTLLQIEQLGTEIIPLANIFQARKSQHKEYYIAPGIFHFRRRLELG